MHLKLLQKESFKKQRKQQNNLEINEEILREKYISPELRQKLLMI